MPIRAVCFDVGETLIDETRHWGEWADFLGVPKLTLFTALGVTMERGQSLRRVFEIFRPDLENPTREDAEPAFNFFQAMPIPYVEPEDIANLALFLASDESRYITGQQIRVDAGS